MNMNVAYPLLYLLAYSNGQICWKKKHKNGKFQTTHKKTYTSGASCSLLAHYLIVDGPYLLESLSFEKQRRSLISGASLSNHGYSSQIIKIKTWESHIHYYLLGKRCIEGPDRSEREQQWRRIEVRGGWILLAHTTVS